MFGKFEIVIVNGEKLIRVEVFDARGRPASHDGIKRAPLCIFDEVIDEGAALRLSFDLWRDVTPCWAGRVKRVKRVKLSPVEALMQEYGAPMTREEYIRWNNLGKNAKVSPEEEAELPTRFQRSQPVEHNEAPKTDRVDKEVLDELARYRKQVGRELTAEETAEIMQSPKMHGWIRYCRMNYEHNARRLRAQGWVQVEYKPGYWRWERKQ